MIELTDDELQYLTWAPYVSSWHGTRWLGDVPVQDGSVTRSSRREIQGSLDLVVPRWAASHVGEDARDWMPGSDPAHPLSHHGQILTIGVQVTAPVSERSWQRPLGRFRITGWEDQGDVVSVRGVSVAGHKIVDDRFTSPTPTRTGGTFASELRRLTPSDIGVIIDPALTDRAVPSMSWPESRMDALKEIAAAWPALLREDGEGTLQVRPLLGEWPEPLWTLTDGQGGTVVDAYSSGSRDGIYNVVVARGQDSDDAGAPTYQGVAEQHGGPFDVDTYGRVVRFFSSPLLYSKTAAERTAATLLADEIRPASSLPVTCAADPRLDLDQPVTIVTDQTRRGWIAGYTMPLTPADMTLDVELA